MTHSKQPARPVARPMPTAAKANTDDFLSRVKQTPVAQANAPQPHSRLLFALDATASRQPTWDQACQLQGEMFQAAAELGGLATQLIWYRGFNEFSASPWVNSAQQLLDHMRGVQCAAGTTQIARVLGHARAETRRQRCRALVLVGDCVEEQPEELYALAGELGLLGVAIFAFHEGRDPLAEQVFRQLALLSKGAYCPFTAGSADQLRSLLKAVAVYAAGGRAALEQLAHSRGGAARLLTQQLG